MEIAELGKMCGHPLPPRRILSHVSTVRVSLRHDREVTDDLYSCQEGRHSSGRDYPEVLYKDQIDKVTTSRSLDLVTIRSARNGTFTRGISKLQK